MIHKYLITVRKHQVKDYVDKSMLDEAMGYLKFKHNTLHIVDQCYEIDSKYKQLHYHAVVEIKHRIVYKDNSRYKLYRIHWVPVRDLEGALRYIKKQAYNKYKQEEILMINYYNNNYAFI